MAARFLFEAEVRVNAAQVEQTIATLNRRVAALRAAAVERGSARGVPQQAASIRRQVEPELRGALREAVSAGQLSRRDAAAISSQFKQFFAQVVTEVKNEARAAAAAARATPVAATASAPRAPRATPRQLAPPDAELDETLRRRRVDAAGQVRFLDRQIAQAKRSLSSASTVAAERAREQLADLEDRRRPLIRAAGFDRMPRARQATAIKDFLDEDYRLVRQRLAERAQRAEEQAEPAPPVASRRRRAAVRAEATEAAPERPPPPPTRAEQRPAVSATRAEAALAAALDHKIVAVNAQREAMQLATVAERSLAQVTEALALRRAGLARPPAGDRTDRSQQEATRRATEAERGLAAALERKIGAVTAQREAMARATAAETALAAATAKLTSTRAQGAAQAPTQPRAAARPAPRPAAAPTAADAGPLRTHEAILARLQAQAIGLQTRAAARGTAQGVPQAVQGLRSRVRDELGPALRADIASGALTMREAAAISLRVKAALSSLADQIKVATQSLNAGLRAPGVPKPTTQGGDAKGLLGGIPSREEVNALLKTVNDPTARAALLRRVAEAATAKRALGLDVGITEEVEFARDQAELRPRRREASRLRKRRETVEELDLLDVTEADLDPNERILAARRLARRRRRDRERYADADIGDEAATALAADRHRTQVGAEKLRQLDPADQAARTELAAALRLQATVARASIEADQQLAAAKQALALVLRRQSLATQIALNADLEADPLRQGQERTLRRQRRTRRYRTDAEDIEDLDVPAEVSNRIAKQRQRRILALEQARQATPDDTRVAAELASLRARQAADVRARAFDVDEAARRRIEADERRRLTTERIRELRPSQDVGPVSAFQRAREYFRPVEGQRQSGLQFLGSKAITSGGFALAGGALYGGVRVIGDMVKEAETLQRTFSLINNQFEAIGEGDQFVGFRRQMLETAREAGVLGSEVATIGFQLKGAFREGTEAIGATAAAIKTGVVTGLPQVELIDSLTAGVRAFRQEGEVAGETLTRISDTAIGLEERFGVLAKESLKVFGDLAPTAREAGLGLKELGAVVGTIQSASGRSGAAIAEGLGRVLPAIGEQASGIVRLYRLIPQLTPNLGGITEALREGRTGDVLLQLARDYQSLDKATQQYVVTLLGGRREAQLLNPLFANSARLVEELDRKQSDAGKTAERYNDLQRTLTQTLARLREEFRQIGDALARAGLFDTLGGIARGTEQVVKFVGFLARGFAYLNEHSGRLVGRLLSIAVAIKSIQIALRGLAEAQTFLAAIRGLEARGAAAAGLASGAAATTATSSRAAAGASAAGSLLGGLAGRGGALSTTPRGTPVTGLAGTVASIGTLTVLAVDTVLLQKVGQAYEREKGDLGTQGSDISARLRAASDAELRRLKESGELSNRSTGLALPLAIFGQTTPQTRLNREIEARRARRTEEQYAAAAKAGIVSPVGLAEEVAKDKGRGRSGEVARRILAQLSDAQRARIAELVAEQQKLNQAAATSVDERLRGLDDLKAAYQAGEAPFSQLLAAYDAEIDSQRSIDTGADPARHAALVALVRERNKVFAENAASAVEFVSQMDQLFGRTADQSAAIAVARQTLQRFNRSAAPAPGSVGPRGDQGLLRYREPEPEASPEQQLALANTLADLQRRALNASIAKASSAAQALGIGQRGVQLDPEARAAYLAYQMQVFGRIVDDPDDIRSTEEELKQLRAQALNETIARIQAANLTHSAVSNAGTAAQVARTRLAAARAEPASPTRETEIAQAEVEVYQAEKARADALLARIDSRDDLRIAQAQARGDAVAVARAQVDKARRRLADARARALDEGVINGIEAELVSVEAQLREANLALLDSRDNLAVARAQAQGDNIGVARAQLAQAQRRLAEATGRGSGETELNSLEAEVISGMASLRDANLAQLEKDLDFQLEMGQINNGQAIARLQARLQAGDLTQDQTRELQLRIKRLRDEVSRDLQFNIGEIRLPTLYEVRRLRQSSEAGMGYQDSRVINAVFHVNNQWDEERARRFMAETVGGSTRQSGTATKAY